MKLEQRYYRTLEAHGALGTQLFLALSRTTPIVPWRWRFTEHATVQDTAFHPRVFTDHFGRVTAVIRRDEGHTRMYAWPDGRRLRIALERTDTIYAVTNECAGAVTCRSSILSSEVACAIIALSGDHSAEYRRDPLPPCRYEHHRFADPVFQPDSAALACDHGCGIAVSIELHAQCWWVEYFAAPSRFE